MKSHAALLKKEHTTYTYENKNFACFSLSSGIWLNGFPPIKYKTIVERAIKHLKITCI